MIPCQYSLYLGRESEHGFADFISEDSFYCILEIEEGYSREEGKTLMEDLKLKSQRTPENLYAYEMFISDAIKKANVPANFSFAAVYRKEDMVYLKTAGSGQIYLNREADFARIIEGDNSASGFVKKGDFFILTTSHFTHLVGSEKQFKHLFSADNLEKNVEELNEKLEHEKSEGTIALFLLFKEQRAQVALPAEKADAAQAPPAPPVKPSSSFFSRFRSGLDSLRDRAQNSPIRQALTKVLLVVVVLILLWSVIMGIKRRSESELNKKIQATQEIIDHKLTQAEDVAPLNLLMAVALINQSKEELSNLQKIVGKRNISEVTEMAAKIKAEEQKITKKEEKSYSEFYDLTVDNKNASGDGLFLDGDDLVILDKKQNVTYVFSLSQKSLDRRSASGMKQATLLGKNESTVYIFVPSSGVHSIDSDSKTKKVIDNDSDWGTIVDMKMYGGNIYLLDSSKSEIYKYVAADGGFSGKTLYLRGQSVDLKESNSLAIDSSVYIGFSDGILKFTSGTSDTFKTSFPDGGVNIHKIFTDENLDKVFAWDKSKGSLYILGKNGTYERQIKSDIFSRATDFVVRGDSAYVLAGSKIYSISVK